MKRLDDIPGTIELDSAAVRAIAAGSDDLTDTRLSLAELWSQLVGGAYRVVDSFHDDQRCYLTLIRPAALGRTPRPLPARKVETLQRTLLGERQKTVALDSNLAASTIALTVAECLRTLGLDSRTARVPSLVAHAAHAARGESEVVECRLSEFTLPPTPFDERERRYHVVSVRRPDLELDGVLSAAEYAVARLLVEGKSYAEMALVRGTSVRTIANQVASVFQKVGVSGRSEFLSWLVRPRRGEARALAPAGSVAPTNGLVPLRTSELRARAAAPVLRRAEPGAWREPVSQREPSSAASPSSGALAAR